MIVSPFSAENSSIVQESIGGSGFHVAIEKILHLGELNLPVHERRANASRQDEGEAPSLLLLVVHHVLDQPFTAGAYAGLPQRHRQTGG
jgi:hypothetical protein